MDIDNTEEFNNSFFQINTPQDINSSYASYGGLKDDLYGDSHLVSVKIQINGADFFTRTNVRLELRQKINDLHEFTLICDPDEFGESNTVYLLQNSKEYLGKRITFQFRQFGKTASMFTGIITQLSTPKKDGLRQIVLRGKSPSILMENGLHSRSFENQTFEEIIKEVAKGYPQSLVNFHINPNYKERLNYIVQYNTTDLQFLQQLSTRFGEYFYYNGEQFCFSAWGGKILELMEGEDVYDYELKMEVEPQSFSYTAYDAKQGTEYTLDSESQKVETSKNPFQQHALNVSESIYTVSPTTHYDQSLLLNGSLDMQRSLERDKRKRQNLVYMEATSNNPELRVGDVAKMMAWMPGHEIFKNGRVPIESYKIIEIVHNFADGEGYTNTFIGVPKDLPVPPYYNESLFPKAEVQHATVTDNQDPLKMGRVRVQFVWQKSGNQQSPWIQVIQPHAGTGKGTYLNPEIGETVVCAFQGGNAEAPIVLGTAYNGGEIAAYYTKGNDIKVIQTRSGTRIVFNDAEGQGSILIEDPSGNRMYKDGQGNTDINVPKRLRMNATDIELNAYNNLKLNVTNQMVSNIMTGMYTFTPYYKSIVSGQMDMFSTTALIHSKSSLNLESQKLTSIGTDQLVLHTEKEAVINSKGTAYMHAEEGNNLTNKAQSVEASNPEEIALAVLEFRPLKEYDAEYGFDWLRLEEESITKKIRKEKNYDFFPRNSYKDLILKRFKSVVSDRKTEEMTTDNYKLIKDKEEAYEALKTEYKQIPIRRDSTEAGEKEYFVPYLKLYSKEFSDKQKNTPPHPYQAELGIFSEVIEEIDKIEVECDGKTQFSEDTIINIEPSDPSGLITEKTKHTKREEENTLTITCNKDFDTDKEINFYAYPKGKTLKTERKLIGRILLGANSEQVRKEMKVLLIPVKTNITKTKDPSGIDIGQIENKADEYLTKILNQVFITPKIEEYSYTDSTGNIINYLDLSSEPNFQEEGKHIDDGSIAILNSLSNAFVSKVATSPQLKFVFNEDLLPDLQKIFFSKKENNKKNYNDYFLVFIFGVMALPNRLIGVVESIGKRRVVLLKNAVDNPNERAALVHEILHGLSLQHTHEDDTSSLTDKEMLLEKNRKYIYKERFTDNIMSYSIEKLFLWHWQGKIVNPDIK